MRQGRIGEPKFFNSSFSMTVRRGDIRTKKAFGGGSLYDIGVYCINAARYLFRAEPTEVVAISVNSGVKTLSEIDESTAAILRFDGDRVASFVTSFNAGDVAEYRIVGTQGRHPRRSGLRVRRGPRLHADRRRQAAAQEHRQARSVRAGAAALLRLHPARPHPEPSGEEGLQDVRIVQALYESAEIGKAVAIPPFGKTRRPSGRQRITRPGVRKPALVKVQSASVD